MKNAQIFSLKGIGRLLIGTVLLICNNAYGQVSFGQYPITRDTFNKFEDTFSIKGRIIYCTGLSPQCGARCTSEQFVVQLSERTPKYPYPYIYIAFTCFDSIIKKDINKTHVLKRKKILTNDESCFWDKGKNTAIDSKGLPFYQLIAHRRVK